MSAGPGPAGKGVWNRTRGTALHERPVWALTRREHALGLMFRKPVEECLVLLLMPQRKVSLHMWFVFAPLDILILDGSGKVVAMRERLAPWRVWNPRAMASAVVELPAGAIRRSRTAVGDTVVLPQPAPSGGFWRWRHDALFWLVQLTLVLAAVMLVLLLQQGRG